jgi:hypothetical protein
MSDHWLWKFPKGNGTEAQTGLEFTNTQALF